MDTAPLAQTVTDDGPFVLREPTRFERLSSPLLTGGVVLGLTIALHFRDPHSSGSWGLCPWYELTGFYCPGCGGLRAVNDLTDGDLLGAASSNLVFVALVPLIIFWWLRWAGRTWRGSPASSRADSRADSRAGSPAAGVVPHRSGAWVAVFTVVLVVFGVLRNTPAGAWLAP